MKKRILSMLLAIVMVIALLPTAALAENDPVSIGRVNIVSTDPDTLSTLFEDFAEVSKSDDGIITIKLTQNITGMIFFDVGAHFIFDANGKTISGQGQNEALCLEHYGYTTVELIGGGVFTTGNNQTIYVGSDNTLIVKDAVIVGEIDNFGTVKTAPQSENAYYVVMINDSLTGLYTEEQTLSDSIELDDTLVVQPLVVEDGDEAIWAGGTNEDGIACGTLSEAIAASASLIVLNNDVALSDNFTLGTVTVDLNGKTLTIPEGKTVTVGEGKSLSVINTTDSAGGLVVAGEVIANGNLNISSLAYGEGGLIKSQGGTLHIGAKGNVTLVPGWVNGDPNNFAILGTTEEGAKLTLGSKFYMYEENAWVEFGSEENPVLITSLADLEALAENVNSGTAGNSAEFYYQLAANIDLTVKYGEGKNSWMPIGTAEKPFKANFDGNGKSITGLYCVGDDLEYAGLFGVMDGSKVKNLTLSGTAIGYGCAGLLAGGGEDVTVTNCTFSGIVKGSYYPGWGSITEYYGEIFGYEEECTYGADDAANDISKVVAYPAGHSVTDGNHIAYEIGKWEGYWEDVTYVRVLGKYPESGERDAYKGKYLPTTYDHYGFELATEGFASDVVDVSVSSVNGGRYAKISYTVNNVGGTEAISGKLGMHADTQIGTNDDATVSVVKSEESGQVIGLSMLDDNGTVDTSDDAQFSLFFAEVAGVDPEHKANTYWFGNYYYAGDHCFDPLTENTAETSSGYYTDNYTSLVGEDSGMAVSWAVNVPASESVTYSVIVGAGAAAKPIKWAESDPLTWALEDNTLSVTANVVDESVGAFDTLFYNLDGEEMQFEPVEVTNAAGTTITKDIELSEGNHVLYFYVGNDLGGFTTQKVVPVAVPDGDDTTYNINGTITSSPNIELKLMQGKKVFAQTITDENGDYLFVNLPKGDYNLVITTAEGATKTVLVTVAGTNESTEPENISPIVPPEAVNNNSIVDNTNAGDFAATVGGLDSIAAALGSGNITLKVTAEAGDENDAEQAEIVSIAGEQELAFIDITLTCSVNGNIGGSNDKLLTIVIPFNGEGKKDIQVYRYHENELEAEKMKKNPGSGEEGFKYENGYVTIYAKKFSTYAIGYTPVVTYTITLNANGGTVNGGDTATLITGTDKKLSDLPTPTRSGSYSFSGWYTAASGGEAVTTDKVYSGNDTIYAQWTYTGSADGGGDYTPIYAIAVEEAGNGIVQANYTYAFSGSTVTITVTPDKGYVLDKLTVTDIFGREVDVAVKDGKYTFKMPAAEVAVKATFKEEVAFQNPFEDVFTTDYYYDAVLWAVKEGITNGTSATTFSPNAPCTRAQMVTFLWCAAGSPEPTSTTCSFTDVDMDSYYGKAVLWAVENGITKGISDTTFSPDMECSRAQMATFLCRMAGGKAESDTIAFTDVKADAYYAESVQWAVENGITNGMGDNKFSPDATCTRGQMVTFLYRYYAK